MDTSAWVDYFRGTSSAAAAVATLVEKGRASICGVIFYELIQGTKSQEEAAQLSAVLSGLHYMEMTPDLWISAGGISAGLRRKGITLPMSDLLIGAMAMEHELEVLTLDDHFDAIPGVKRFKHD